MCTVVYKRLAKTFGPLKRAEMLINLYYGIIRK